MSYIGFGERTAIGLGLGGVPTFVSRGGSSPIPPSTSNFLLQENGFYILQENGGRIYLENAVPPVTENAILQEVGADFIVQEDGSLFLLENA